MSERWYTTEDPPRRITVLGRSAFNPDVSVAENPDGGVALWILDNGSEGPGPFTVIARPTVAYSAIRITDPAP